MKCMNIMQCKSLKKKIIKHQKKNGHKEYWDEAQAHIKKTQFD